MQQEKTFTINNVMTQKELDKYIKLQEKFQLRCEAICKILEPLNSNYSYLSDFELDADGLAHTALDDAHNTGKILLKMLEAGWTYEAYVEAREECVAAHLAKKQTA